MKKDPAPASGKLAGGDKTHPAPARLAADKRHPGSAIGSAGNKTAKSPAPETEFDPSSNPKRVTTDLAVASDAVEAALKQKLDATAARRLLEGAGAHPQEDRTGQALRAKRKKLELESATAGVQLAQAQRRKLELEAKLRSSAVDAVRRRAKAEAECEDLRKQAQVRLQDEENRLRERYAAAAEKLEGLKEARRQAEAKLRDEQSRIESEFAESEKTLQLEARQIKGELERVKHQSHLKAEQIRTEEASEEARVRNETEVGLLEDRRRLEADFARSVAELEQAQKKLRDAQAAKARADTEAKSIVASMRAAEAKRHAEAEAQRRSERERLEAEAAGARRSVEEAKRVKETAEDQRRAVMRKLARIRAAGDEAERAAGGDEVSLRVEIERMDASVSQAAEEFNAARRARDDLDAVKLAAEERAAAQRATEDELRSRLHEEADEWLRQEKARSQAALDKAKQELADKWALKEKVDLKRRESHSGSKLLLEDISAQLDEAGPVLEAEVDEKAGVQEKTAMVRPAREEVGGSRDAPREMPDRDHERIARLRRQGLLD